MTRMRKYYLRLLAGAALVGVLVGVRYTLALTVLGGALWAVMTSGMGGSLQQSRVSEVVALYLGVALRIGMGATLVGAALAFGEMRRYSAMQARLPWEVALTRIAGSLVLSTMAPLIFHAMLALVCLPRITDVGFCLGVTFFAVVLLAIAPPKMPLVGSAEALLQDEALRQEERRRVLGSAQEPRRTSRGVSVSPEGSNSSQNEDIVLH